MAADWKAELFIPKIDIASSNKRLNTIPFLYGYLNNINLKKIPDATRMRGILDKREKSINSGIAITSASTKIVKFTQRIKIDLVKDFIII